MKTRRNTGNRSALSTSASGNDTPPDGLVTSGVWFAAPSERGPYPAGGAPAGTASISMTAETKPFDSAVTSSTADAELFATETSIAGSLAVINPGQTGTINVTITPSAAVGTVVSGNLYVDDLNTNVPPPAASQEAGNELAALPYTYTVG